MIAWSMAAMMVTGLSSAVQAAEEDSAQADSQAGQYKIRVVDRKRVFDAYDKVQDELKALETEKQQLQEKLDGLSESVLEKKNEFEEKEATLTDDEKDALEEEVQKRYMEYRTEFKRMQDEIDMKHAKLIRDGREEIDEAVAVIGVEENCHLILEGDPKSSSGVLYYSTTIDITDKVIERLNGK